MKKIIFQTIKAVLVLGYGGRINVPEFEPRLPSRIQPSRGTA